MIVIGLGTGRSGTASLATLLNAQRNSHVFHEMNPSCVRFTGTTRPILNAIDEFQRILTGGPASMLTVDLSRKPSIKSYEALAERRGITLMGDVAFYYLSYVKTVADHNREVRFLCTRRDIDESVKSWIVKSRVNRWPSKQLADRLSCLITRQPYYESANYWMVHDGSRWEPDPVWDKCFPKFEAESMPEAIRKYCEFYYEQAERLAAALPDRFRFVETNRLNDRASQAGVLDFLEIARKDQVLEPTHVNRSASS